MELDKLSMTNSLLHELLPAALVAVVASAAWLCRSYHCAKQRAWREVLRRPDGYEAATLDARIGILIAQRSVAGRGSPADRLFFVGLTVAAVLCLFGLTIYWPH
jgi:hypothetical protein